MSCDAEDHRRTSAEHWEEAAPGWARRQAAMRAFTDPLAHRMVAALRVQPGHRVLELAAGLGETGFLAAELLAPGGTLISSDQAEGMLSGARARAQDLGLTNVDFRLINGEWIDLPVADVDGVLCRFGLMLMADPGAALGEMRRVLRPAGRLALAVWAGLEVNPWAALPARVMRELVGGEPPAAGTPGPFALADIGRLRDLIDEAGFAEVEIEPIDLVQRQPDFDAFWETQLDLSRGFHDTVMSQPAEVLARISEQLRAELAPYTHGDGSLHVPARALLACAEA